MDDRTSNLHRRRRHPAHRSRVAAAIASGVAFAGLVGCTAIASTDDGSSTTTTDATAAADSTTSTGVTTTDASQYSDPEWGGSATAGSGSASGGSSTQSQGS
jgi:hypothetical protein